MKNRLPFKEKSLLFAPMEGVTDGPYREAVSRSFGEWDYFSTDFYRVPSVGKINPKSVLKHYGLSALENKSLKNKTSYQILTSAKAQTTEVVKIIDDYGFHHLDLNLGCPSKKVNAHKGGAYLFEDLPILKSIIRDIRNNFKGVFTVKIRTGYRDDSLFLDLLKLFEDEGVEAITLHARTRDQLYQGVANWDYIKRAVEYSNLPIIGNGDVWTLEDIQNIFEECEPYAIMLGRGALKTPWLADLYSRYKENIDFLSDKILLEERKESLKIYFYELEKEYRKEKLIDDHILKRFKSYSRYLFDDFEDADKIKSSLLRSHELATFKHNLETHV